MPTAVSSATRLYLELSTKIATAYVSSNYVPAAELPALLGTIHNTLSALTSGGVATNTGCDATAGSEARSAAEVKKSIRPDGLVSFLDGRAYKTLKRHLTSHGLDPSSYRTRYGLPADYPMVAEEYSTRRSALAIQIGLGRAGLSPEG